MLCLGLSVQHSELQRAMFLSCSVSYDVFRYMGDVCSSVQQSPGNVCVPGAKLTRIVQQSMYTQMPHGSDLGSVQFPYVCVRCYEQKFMTPSLRSEIPCFGKKDELVAHFVQEHLGLTKIYCRMCLQPLSESSW